MKRILAVCLVLVFASAALAYDEVILESFESWEPEPQGWLDWTGTSIIYGQTIGVTDGQWSAAVIGSFGWGPLWDYGVNAAVFNSHSILELDVTTTVEEMGGVGGNIGFLIVSDAGGLGWNTFDVAAINPGTTQHLEVDYGAIKTSNASWVYVGLFEDTWDAAGHTDSIYYIDRLAVRTPEPATMALLGLGGLALIRRKK